MQETGTELSKQLSLLDDAPSSNSSPHSPSWKLVCVCVCVCACVCASAIVVRID